MQTHFPWKELWDRSLVLIVSTSLALTTLTTIYVGINVEREESSRFQETVREMRNQLLNRLDHYEDLLLLTRSYFATEANPSLPVLPSDFRAYTENLDFRHRYQGLQGVGYAAWIPNEKTAKFERLLRRKNRKNFRIWPPSKNPFKTPIVMIEPLDWRNTRALGYDMFSHPDRRQAMESAMKSGKTSMTAGVTLVQETENEPQVGFLVFCPLIQQNRASAARGNSRGRLLGFVYAPIRAQDFFSSIFGPRKSLTDFEVYDGEKPERSALLYDADPSIFAASRDLHPLRRESQTVPVFGRKWTLVWFEDPSFQLISYRNAPYFTLLAGLVATLFLSKLYLSTKVHERQQASLYQEAKKLIQIRDEFLSIASHELNTPLTTLKLQLQMVHREIVSRGSLNPERGLKLLEISERQIVRLARLIEDMLDVSHLNSGQLSIHPETFDLNELALEIVDRFQMQLQASNLSASIKYTRTLIGSWDRLRVDQAITNLITNALKYGRGKPIEIELCQQGQFATLAVKDYGIGIAPENLPRIFERFERAVSSRNISGLGLGLYIAQQVAKAHGGRIEVSSRPEEGSTFTLFLPLIPPLAPTLSPSTQS